MDSSLVVRDIAAAVDEVTDRPLKILYCPHVALAQLLQLRLLLTLHNFDLSLYPIYVSQPL